MHEASIFLLEWVGCGEQAHLMSQSSATPTRKLHHHGTCAT